MFVGRVRDSEKFALSAFVSTPGRQIALAYATDAVALDPYAVQPAAPVTDHLAAQPQPGSPAYPHEIVELVSRLVAVHDGHYPPNSRLHDRLQASRASSLSRSTDA